MSARLGTRADIVTEVSPSTNSTMRLISSSYAAGSMPMARADKGSYVAYGQKLVISRGFPFRPAACHAAVNCSNDCLMSSSDASMEKPVKPSA